jgi:hypothetical protein
MYTEVLVESVHHIQHIYFNDQGRIQDFKIGGATFKFRNLVVYFNNLLNIKYLICEGSEQEFSLRIFVCFNSFVTHIMLFLHNKNVKFGINS